MSVPTIARSVAALAATWSVLATTVLHTGVAFASSAGLLQYFDRHDRLATATLEDELAAGSTDPQIPLALGDLYLMQGNMPAARAALDIAATTAIEPTATRARVWVSWVDFEARQYAAAEQALERIIASTAAGDASDEARFTLGWQQMLTGRYRDAAATFGTLAPRTGDHWLEFPDQALLLEGQALLWAQDVAAAEAPLRQLLESYPSSPVADDALRDLAWCAHLQGDDATAKAQLDDVSRSYDRAHFASESRLAVEWPTVVAQGAHVLAKPLWRAYRRRPRGEPPLPFLLGIGNRTAAADARALLLVLTNAANPIAVVHARTAVTPDDASIEPWADSGSSPNRTLQPTSTMTNSQRSTILTVLLALLVVWLISNFVRQRRGSGERMRRE